MLGAEHGGKNGWVWRVVKGGMDREREGWDERPRAG